eukprot:scaffold97058_cov22-Tisochrysis_lutea.AAC.1
MSRDLEVVLRYPIITSYVCINQACSVVHNLITEHHNIASRVIMKMDNSHASNLVHMDEGSADFLAQHDLHIPEQVSSRIAPPDLFKPSIPD